MGTNNFHKYQGSKSGNEETWYFNTNGRVSRMAFFLRVLFVLGIYLASCLFVNFGIYEDEGFFHKYLLPFLLIVFLLIQGAKRMHDVDRSGWAFLIPGYNLYLSILPGTNGNNSFGVDPSPPAVSEYFEDPDSFEKGGSGSLVYHDQESYWSQLISIIKFHDKKFLLLLLVGVLILAVICGGDWFDGGGGKTDDLDEAAPTNITLSSAEIMENATPGTQVGTLSAEDVDEEDTHTYALVAGEGDTDNGSFAISGNSLTTTKSFDFESKNSYSIRVQVMDESGGTYVRQLPIQVSDDVSDNQNTGDYRIPGSSIPDKPSPKPKEPDLFYCKGDGQPIRLDKYQNGTCDCPDGSDELPGTCK